MMKRFQKFLFIALMLTLAGETYSQNNLARNHLEFSEILSAIKKAEQSNEHIIHPAEIEGKDVNAGLSLPFSIKTARRLNNLESPISNVETPVIHGNKLLLKFKPHEIITLGIETN